MEGFTGIGHSVEDCLYKAKWEMTEHVELLRQRGLPAPEINRDPTIVVQNVKEGSTMSRIESAVSLFNKGYSCSQAVLSTYGPQYGLDEAAALRLATAFGAGMGRMADTCGAVTGAFMVLGLKHGTTLPDDREGKERTYQRVRQFASRFKARCGSAVCRDLLGCDISTPEGLDLARQRGLFATACPRFVQTAAEILEELLAS